MDASRARRRSIDTIDADRRDQTQPIGDRCRIHSGTRFMNLAISPRGIPEREPAKLRALAPSCGSVRCLDFRTNVDNSVNPRDPELATTRPAISGMSRPQIDPAAAFKNPDDEHAAAHGILDWRAESREEENRHPKESPRIGGGCPKRRPTLNAPAECYRRILYMGVRCALIKPSRRPSAAFSGPPSQGRPGSADRRGSRTIRSSVCA
jgi:hypothetical protein